MAKKGKPDKSTDRRVVRKRDQLMATLRDVADRKDFETRLRAKCEESGFPVPPLVPHGMGDQVAIVCKDRNQAIFLQDFAEEAVAEMPK